MVRLHSLFANTQFMAVAFHPTGVQVITSGTDRKIGYWEVYDGTLVRQVEGSPYSGLNTIDISRDGQYIATGGNDQFVKIWKYQEGVITYVGAAHAGVVLDVKFSPDGKYIMSVSSDGGVMRWKCPYDLKPVPQGDEASRPVSQGTHSSCSERQLRVLPSEHKKPQDTPKTSAASVKSSKSSGSSKKDAGTSKSATSLQSSAAKGKEHTQNNSTKSESSAAPKKASKITTKGNTKMMKVK